MTAPTYSFRPQIPVLAPGDVALCLLHLPALAEHELATLAATLDERERARNRQISLGPMQRQDLAARGMLRRLLGRQLGLAPGAVSLVRNRHGRPELAGAQAQLSFNYSHSGDYVVYALCRGGTVGVDIEASERRPRALAIARRYFQDSEYQALAALPDSELDTAFLRLWTLKEAYLKARGVGISAGLDSIVFAPGADGAVTPIAPSALAGRWAFHSLVPVPGYRVALAIDGKNTGRQFSLRSVSHC